MNNNSDPMENSALSRWTGPILEIKDHSVLLAMASEYLCETPSLKRIGGVLEKDVQALRDQIRDLKRRFVGKPAQEIDANGPLEEIERIAKGLQRADPLVYERCSQGKLGNELLETTRALVEKLAALQDRVEGRLAPSPRPEPVTEVLDRLKGATYFLGVFSRYSARILGLTLLLILGLFFALFISMEKVDQVQRQVSHTRAEIESRQAAISRVEGRRKRILERIDAFTQQDLTRQQKVELIDLNLRAHKLSEEKEKIQIELAELQKTLGLEQEKLEKMRQKSFLERLFRL